MTDWAAVAAEAARRHGIDETTFVSQMRAESGLKPGRTSGAGAQGIAQIMPATAKGWGVDPNDPHAALNAAAKAMSKYLRSYKGDWRKALAAYNAGPGAVAKYGGVPPYDETRTYIKRILGGSNPPGGASRARTGAPSVSSVDPDTEALEFIFKGSPWEGFATKYASETTTAPSLPTSASRRVPLGRDYRWLQKQGQRLFGLRNDPGNSQTNGGRHTTGSEHYSDRAIDFGTALNSAEQLAKWKAWAKRQGLDVLDEGDHVHVSFPGRGI